MYGLTAKKNKLTGGVKIRFQKQWQAIERVNADKFFQSNEKDG